MSLLRRMRTALTSPGRITFSEACAQTRDTTCLAQAQRQRTRAQVQNALSIRL